MLQYLTALFYFDGETALAACVLRVTNKKSSTFLRKKVHPVDLAGGFSDLKMTWLLHCAGAATGPCHIWEPGKTSVTSLFFLPHSLSSPFPPFYFHSPPFSSSENAARAPLARVKAICGSNSLTPFPGLPRWYESFIEIRNFRDYVENEFLH